MAGAVIRPLDQGHGDRARADRPVQGLPARAGRGRDKDRRGRRGTRTTRTVPPACTSGLAPARCAPGPQGIRGRAWSCRRRARLRGRRRGSRGGLPAPRLQGVRPQPAVACGSGRISEPDSAMGGFAQTGLRQRDHARPRAQHRPQRGREHRRRMRWPAAVRTDRRWAITPATRPVRTSPIPADAMPGLPASIT